MKWEILVATDRELFQKAEKGDRQILFHPNVKKKNKQGISPYDILKDKNLHKLTKYDIMRS